MENFEVTDPNCIIKAFSNNKISILKEETNNKFNYWFKSTDIATTLDLTNIYSSVQNYDENEKCLKEVDTSGGKQKILFLSSQGVYRLLYNSKKSLAKQFRKWVGDILDDIIFNQNKELLNQVKQLTKDKARERHETLLKLFSGNNIHLVYLIKVYSYKNGTYIIKIGESRCGLIQRVSEFQKIFGFDNVIILDCYHVIRSNKFETFLHHHPEIRPFNEKTLKGHETDKELFIIGGKLTYSRVVQIIEENIHTFNEYSNVKNQLEVMTKENEQLLIMKDMVDNEDFKIILHKIVNGHEELLTKISKLENKVEELSSIILSSQQKTTTNFGEHITNVGDRVQKINPETLLLVQTYESVADVINQHSTENHTSNWSRSGLERAIRECTVYDNFRWNYVDRNSDPNIIINLQPTKDSRVQNIGYIAKLNKDKTEILNVYLDRATAAQYNNIPNSTMETIVKSVDKFSKFDTCYYLLYKQCDDTLHQAFKIKNGNKEPILYKKHAIGVFDKNNNLIEEYKSRDDWIKNFRIGEEKFGNKTIDKLLKKGTLLRDTYYIRHIQDKVKCL